MYPPLLQKIDDNNRDWLESWGCVIEQSIQAAVCVNPNFGHFNAIFAIHCLEEKAAAIIRDLAQMIKQTSGHNAAIWYDKYCTPANLPEILTEFGFTLVSTSYVMHARPEEVMAKINQNLTTGLVTNEEELSTWIEMYCQAFGRMSELDYERRRWLLAFRSPLVRHEKLWFFLGSDGPDLVITGQLITTRKIGGIYCIGTHPDLRRQGYGSTMTVDIAKSAGILGLKDLYLIAQDEDNKRFYERMGFKEVLQNRIYEPA